MITTNQISQYDVFISLISVLLPNPKRHLPSPPLVSSRATVMMQQEGAEDCTTTRGGRSAKRGRVCPFGSEE